MRLRALTTVEDKIMEIKSYSELRKDIEEIDNSAMKQEIIVHYGNQKSRR